MLLARIDSAWLLVMDYSLFKQEPAQQMLGERWHGKTWQVDRLECASGHTLSIIGGVIGGVLVYLCKPTNSALPGHRIASMVLLGKLHHLVPGIANIKFPLQCRRFSTLKVFWAEVLWFHCPYNYNFHGEVEVPEFVGASQPVNITWAYQTISKVS